MYLKALCAGSMTKYFGLPCNQHTYIYRFFSQNIFTERTNERFHLFQKTTTGSNQKESRNILISASAVSMCKRTVQPNKMHSWSLELDHEIQGIIHNPSTPIHTIYSKDMEKAKVAPICLKPWCSGFLLSLLFWRRHSAWGLQSRFFSNPNHKLQHNHQTVFKMPQWIAGLEKHFRGPLQWPNTLHHLREVSRGL